MDEREGGGMDGEVGKERLAECARASSQIPGTTLTWGRSGVILNKVVSLYTHRDKPTAGPRRASEASASLRQWSGQRGGAGGLGHPSQRAGNQPRVGEPFEADAGGEAGRVERALGGEHGGKSMSVHPSR